VPEAKPKRRSHRASYPTPGFYLFAFLLNLFAVLIGGMFYFLNNSSIQLMAFAAVAVMGVFLSIIALLIRPKEANKKLRKVLIGFIAAYGFVVLAAIGATILLTPLVVFNV